MAKKKEGVLTIDPEDIQDRLSRGKDIDDHEARWLQDRDQLPREYEAQPVTFNLPDGSVVSNDPVAVREMARNLDLESDPHFKAMVEREVQSRLADLAQQQLQGQTAVGDEYHGNAMNEPSAGTAARGEIVPAPDNSNIELEDEDEEEEDEEEDDDEETEEEVDYNNMTTDDLRGELSSRNLSVEGRKADLITRLQEDDAKED